MLKIQKINNKLGDKICNLYHRHKVNLPNLQRVPKTPFLKDTRYKHPSCGKMRMKSTVYSYIPFLNPSDWQKNLQKFDNTLSWQDMGIHISSVRVQIGITQLDGNVYQNSK